MSDSLPSPLPSLRGAAQIPPRPAFFPEVVRAAAGLLGATAAQAALDGAVDRAFVAGMLLRAAAVVLCHPLLICGMRDGKVADPLCVGDVETCPRPLRPLRDAVVAFWERKAVRLPAPFIERLSLQGVSLGVALLTWTTASPSRRPYLGDVIFAQFAVAGSCAALKLLGERTAGSVAALESLERRIDSEASVRGAAARVLDEQLSGAEDEEEMTRVAVAALLDRFPSAIGLVAATFPADLGSVVGPVAGGGAGPEGEVDQALAACCVDAEDERTRAALAAVFRGRAPASGAGGGRKGGGAQAAAAAGKVVVGNGPTSVVFVSRRAHGPAPVADSADFPNRLKSFADWSALEQHAGVTRALTCALNLGPRPVGFLSLFFRGVGAQAVGPSPAERLADVAEALADAVVLHRVRNTHEASLRLLRSAQGISRDAFPDHVARALEARAQRGQLLGRGGGGFAAGGNGPHHVTLAPQGSPAAPQQQHEGGGDGDGAPAGASWPGPSSPSRALPKVSVDDAGVPQPLSVVLPGSGPDAADILSDFWPSLTVIFADVVAFTELSGVMAPAETMALLSSLFHRFDSLTISHGVYKVETIGDRRGAPPSTPRARPAMHRRCRV